MTGMPPGRQIDAYRLKFSGQGFEYFRVWIVNILMLIITFGLFTPWARWRNARYFYDHTSLAHSPLEFTGSLRRMIVSFFLYALLYLAYEIAGHTGQDTAVLLFLVGAAVLAPFIWGSAVRFRLASTRWRGLSLRFSAPWKEVYLASWPIFAMAAVGIGVAFGLDQLGIALPAQSPQPGRPFTLPVVTPAMWGLIGAGIVLGVLCIVRVDFNYKSLLVLRAGVGAQGGRWKPVYGDFVRIWGAALLVFALSVAILGGLVVLTAVLADGMAKPKFAPGPAGIFMALLLVAVVFLLALFVATAPALAYRQARMFHLFWNNVGLSQIARFKSDLRPWAFVRLRLLNVLLTVLTLGLYRPFARIREYRMKVDSVTFYVKGGLDQLEGELVKQQEALGDALANVIGLDIVG